MAKSALANALKERSAKLSASSSNADQTVDEAFEGLFGTPAASSITRSTAKIPLEQLHPFFTSNIGFKPYSEENLKMLADDIAKNGLIENIRSVHAGQAATKFSVGITVLMRAKCWGWIQYRQILSM